SMSSYWRAPRPLRGGGPALGRGASPAFGEAGSHRAGPPEAPPAPAARACLRRTRFRPRGSRVSTSALLARFMVHLLSVLALRLRWASTARRGASRLA